MSWGGIVAPWVVVVLAAIFIPLHLLSAQVLLATLVMRAVSVAVFEVPVVQRVGEGGSPAAELGKRARSGGLDRGRRIGTAAGIATFALIWLVA